MVERYEVRVRVISQNGTCEQGHKEGDEWVIGNKTPEGVCFSAFHCLLPSARVLMYGGSFPWETDPDIYRGACPDPENPVVFELRRLRK